MGLDRRIDPATGDYIDDGAGGDEDTDSVETAAYHQIKTERGEWWADPDKGSDLHLVPRLSVTQALELLPATLESALQALVDAGLARSQRVEVAAHPTVPNRIIGITEIVDIQRGPVDLATVAGLAE